MSQGCVPIAEPSHSVDRVSGTLGDFSDVRLDEAAAALGSDGGHRGHHSKWIIT